MSSKPILGYWDIRGLAQPIRYLLTYAGVDFVDKRYTATGTAPNFDISEWKNDKFNLGLDFPNIPYYMEGDLKMSQSIAILRYLASKHNLEGETEQEKIRVWMCEQQLMDMLMAAGRICYNPNVEELKVEYIKNLPPVYELMSKFVGDGPFVAGKKLTYVDFLLYEYLMRIKHFVPEVYEKVDNLKAYVQRMEALPKLDAYIKNHTPKPFNGAPALWNITA